MSFYRALFIMSSILAVGVIFALLRSSSGTGTARATDPTATPTPDTRFIASEISAGYLHACAKVAADLPSDTAFPSREMVRSVSGPMPTSAARLERRRPSGR